MKAIRIHNYGSFEQLKYEEVPMPTIKNDQLLVKVYVTSVNHLEILKASGKMKEVMPIDFPWIPGFDFAGVIEEVGNDITSFKKGDKVYGNCNGGSYAEYLAINVNKVVKMPASLSYAEAATVPHVGETAWQALYKHGKLEEEQTVLIHGGAGAVGAFAVQFAKNTGAKVFATAAGDDIDFVKSLGADEVINFMTQDFTETFNNVDLVLLLVGGDTEKKSYSVMNKGGRLVSTVGLSYQNIANEKGINATTMVIEQSAEDLGKITELINAGKVKTDVGIVYPLKETEISWKAMSGDRNIKHPSHGKIVLEVNK